MEKEILRNLWYALLFTTLISLSGGTLLICLTEILGIKKGIKFYSKLSYQLSKQIFWILGVSIVLFGILTILKFDFYYFIFWWVSILTIGGFLIFYKAFKKLKYLFLMISCCGSLLLSYLSSRLFSNFLKNKEIFLLKFTIPNPLGILLFFIILLISISTFSFLAKVYLLIRRNKDDYGRDYYKFSIKYISKWNITFISVLFLWGIKFIDTSVIEISSLILTSITIILAVFLSYRTIIAEVPLRYKGSIILSAIFAFATFGIMFNYLYLYTILPLFKS